MASGKGNPVTSIPRLAIRLPLCQIQNVMPIHRKRFGFDRGESACPTKTVFLGVPVRENGHLDNKNWRMGFQIGVSCFVVSHTFNISLQLSSHDEEESIPFSCSCYQLKVLMKKTIIKTGKELSSRWRCKKHFLIIYHPNVNRLGRD